MFHKLLMLVMCAFTPQNNQKCTLNSRQDFYQPLPVILKDGRLLEPTDSYGNIELNSGDTLTLSCDGAGSISHPNVRNQRTTATITCESGVTFLNNEWLDNPSSFSLFRCDEPPPYAAQQTNRSCFQNNPIYEVGYRVEGEFYPHYESCFDEGNLNAVYSKYTQKSYNSNFQTKIDRPFFISDNLYGHIPVETLFSPHNQRSAVHQRVGGVIDRYVTKSEFLSRGHLAAKTDFVFAFGQRATFHYVNCAPQWYGFNSGNWNTLEVDLRLHIHAANLDCVIYTGTFGVSQLTNEYGNKVDIYLATDQNNNPVIPVPMYYYKIVYNPSTKQGTAFVGINNPYYTLEEAKDMFFCRDVCRGNRDFRWLTWNPDSATNGYSFCCTVPDFRSTVHHLPDFEVRSLLT